MESVEIDVIFKNIRVKICDKFGKIYCFLQIKVLYYIQIRKGGGDNATKNNGFFEIMERKPS